MSDQSQSDFNETADGDNHIPSFDLVVSPDNLEVSVQLQGPFRDPAKNIDELVTLIHEELKRLKICDSFFVPDMKNVLLNGLKNDQKIIVAKKELIEKGVEGKIDFLVQLDFSPQELTRISLKDPKDLGTTARIVNENHDLVEITKETQSPPYLDIFEKETIGKPIEKVKIPNFDENSICMIETENGWMLKSKKRGYFQKSQNKLEISSEIVADKVDLSSIGNVLGDGFIDIRINGNRYAEKDTVCEGFHLVGNKIVITGNLGNGVILEGNEIVVNGKIRQNCQIKAKTSLIADYVQGAHIEASTVKINDCWFSDVSGNNLLIRRDLVGSKLFGEKALLLGEVKNSSVMATDFIGVVKTHELEPSRFIISPFAIKKNQMKFEKLKINVQKAKMAIFKTKTLLDLQKKIGNSIIKNIIKNVSQLNMILYNSEQREKIAFLFKTGNEEPWLKSIKITPAIVERILELRPVRQKIQELTKTLGLESSHLKMSESALNKMTSQEENSAIYAMNDLLQGSRVAFGDAEFIIKDSRLGSYQYYIKNGVIGSKEFKVKSSELKNCKEDVALFFQTLKSAIEGLSESPKC